MSQLRFTEIFNAQKDRSAPLKDCGETAAFLGDCWSQGRGQTKSNSEDSDEKDSEVLETLAHNREISSVLERDQGG